MGKFWGFVTGAFAFIGGLGGLLFAAASVTPEQMMSALAKWADFIGAQMPNWAAIPDIDQHAQVLGLEAMTVGALGIALTVVMRARLRRPVELERLRDTPIRLPVQETKPRTPVSAPDPVQLPPPQLREHVDIAPQFLIDLYNGQHTSLQADSLFTIYKGKWMVVRRPIRDVVATSEMMVIVEKQDEDNSREGDIILWFSREWTTRLSAVPRGGVINALGRIHSVGSGILTLRDCELTNRAG